MPNSTAGTEERLMAKKELKDAKRRRWHREDTELALLGFPTFLWYVIFSYAPMFGIIISFKKYKLFPRHGFLYNLIHSQWVGFDNFQFFFKSKNFGLFLRNTLGYNIIFITLGVVIPVTLAIMINELYSKKASKVYQTAMFFPHFLSWVVVSYFVFAFLNEAGLVNNVIKALGGEKHRWYQEATAWPFFFVFLKVWKGTGYSMVVYLATITGIDGSMYEAAMLDGASKWQQAKYITIPTMKQVVVMMFILAVGGIFASDFGLFYQTTQRIPSSLYNVASTFDTYIYNALQDASTPIGKTSAVSTFQSVCCCATILLANWIVSKIDNESAVF